MEFIMDMVVVMTLVCPLILPPTIITAPTSEIAREKAVATFTIISTLSSLIIRKTVSLVLLPRVKDAFLIAGPLVFARGPAIRDASFTLGGRTVDTVFLIMRELRVDIMVNVATAFSRAISEVGAVMIVGGNIKGQTRVMTTTISMMNSMGDYPTAIALGTILLLISFVIHSLIYSYGQGDE